MAKARKKADDAASAKASNGAGDGQVEIPEVLTYESSAATYHAGQYTHDELGLSADDLKAMYRNMLLQRRFEERAAQMYGRQKIAGFLHLYIGQEAVSTGSAWAMNIGTDSVITAYRDHGIGLALGMDTNACMAELFGKSTGCSKGKGGSMHYFDADLRMYGGHGIVGGHIPVGGGIAFAHPGRRFRVPRSACAAGAGAGPVFGGDRGVPGAVLARLGAAAGGWRRAGGDRGGFGADGAIQHAGLGAVDLPGAALLRRGVPAVLVLGVWAIASVAGTMIRGR